MLILRDKSPLPEKFSSEENQTHDAASSRTASPTHYQRAIPAHTRVLLEVDVTRPGEAERCPPLNQCHVCRIDPEWRGVPRLVEVKGLPRIYHVFYDFRLSMLE